MARKIRSDAALLNLPEERQEQIVEWCDTPKSGPTPDGQDGCAGGFAFAREQLAADGVKVSLRALSDFYSQWHLRQDLSLAASVEEAVKAANPADVEKARAAGESMLLTLSLARKDAELFTAASMSIDSKRRLDLEEKSGNFKAETKKIQLAQKDRDYALEERKFQRDTCKLFLKWFDAEAAKKIATSGLSNQEKIEQLGLAMFGEDWKA